MIDDVIEMFRATQKVEEKQHLIANNPMESRSSVDQPFEVQYANLHGLTEYSSIQETMYRAAIWITDQLPTAKWSVRIEEIRNAKVVDRIEQTNIYIAFDTAEAATLFKVFQT
jgi:hypothetical protein